jgi:hypothetical protein
MALFIFDSAIFCLMSITSVIKEMFLETKLSTLLGVVLIISSVFSFVSIDLFFVKGKIMFYSMQ